MNKRQRKRWLLTAQGMCASLWPTMTNKRKARLWAEVEAFIKCHWDEAITSWDQDECYLCDSFDDFFDDHLSHIWLERFSMTKENPCHFFNRARFVVRASIDLVGGAGFYGCVGCTVGDLRRVFGGKLPRWVTRQYEGLTDQTQNAELIEL